MTPFDIALRVLNVAEDGLRRGHRWFEVCTAVRAELIEMESEERSTEAGAVDRVAELKHALKKMTEQRDTLRDAIDRHRTQKGDDRCWIDDKTLYNDAGLEEAMTALPPKEEFLANCARFHECRQKPGAIYVTVEQRLAAGRQAIIQDVGTFIESLREDTERTDFNTAILHIANRVRGLK